MAKISARSEFRIQSRRHLLHPEPSHQDHRYFATGCMHHSMFDLELAMKSTFCMTFNSSEGFSPNAATHLRL